MKDPKDLKDMKFTDIKKDSKQAKPSAKPKGGAPSHLTTEKTILETKFEEGTPTVAANPEVKPENFAAPDTILFHKSRKDKMVICLRINGGFIVKGMVTDSSRYTVELKDATIPSGKKEIKVKRCVVNKHAIEFVYLEDELE